MTSDLGGKNVPKDTLTKGWTIAGNKLQYNGVSANYAVAEYDSDAGAPNAAIYVFDTSLNCHYCVATLFNVECA